MFPAPLQSRKYPALKCTSLPSFKVGNFVRLTPSEISITTEVFVSVAFRVVFTNIQNDLQLFQSINFLESFIKGNTNSLAFLMSFVFKSIVCIGCYESSLLLNISTKPPAVTTAKVFPFGGIQSAAKALFLFKD